MADIGDFWSIWQEGFWFIDFSKNLLPIPIAFYIIIPFDI